MGKMLIYILLMLHGSTQNVMGNDSTEHALIDKLFSTYKTAARPRLNSSQSVSVSLSFSLHRLDGLDERRQVLTTTGWLTVEWQDEFLIWNPGNYSGLESLVVPANYVWLPAFALDNSGSAVYQSDHYNLFRITIRYDGLLTWEPGGSFETSCEMDTRFYPFDRQNCTILFANWVYTKKQVDLLCTSDVVYTETYRRGGEWVLHGTSSSRREMEFAECCPGAVYPEVAFTLLIQRKHSFYIVNILVPCVILSLLALMIFHLPPDAGEKISLGVTVLLAFSVFQLMIAETLPPASTAVPLVEIYLLGFMATSAFSVVISVLVLNIHHRTEYNPPPAWLRKLILGWVAPVLCMRRKRTNAARQTMTLHPTTTAEKEKSDNGYTSPIPHIHISETEPDNNSKSVFTPSLNNHKPHQSRRDSTAMWIEGNRNHEAHFLSQQSNLLTVPEDDIVPVHKRSSLTVTPSSTISQLVALQAYCEKSDIDQTKKNLRIRLHSPVSDGNESRDSELETVMPTNVARSAMKLVSSISNLARSNSPAHRELVLRELIDSIKELNILQRKNELEALLESEWKSIAIVVDRLFFYITSFFLVVFSGITFGYMTSSI